MNQQQPIYGLKGANSALSGAYRDAQSALQDGINQGRQDLMNYGLQGAQYLNPYLQQGTAANTYAAQLSGAMGDQAQQDAYNRFQASPGQQYLQDEAERAITRNAAALGGLGGGNVLQALQQNAIGLAAQDFDNSFNRLSGLADRGFGAGGAMGNLYGDVGSQLADTSLTGGLAGSDLSRWYGDRRYGGRLRTGELMSQNINATTSALANLQRQGGLDVANQMGAQSNNLASLLSGGGINNANTINQLANLLANLSTQSASQYNAANQLPGWQQPGRLNDIGNLLSGAGNAMTGWNS